MPESGRIADDSLGEAEPGDFATRQGLMPSEAKGKAANNETTPDDRAKPSKDAYHRTPIQLAPGNHGFSKFAADITPEYQRGTTTRHISDTVAWDIAQCKPSLGLFPNTSMQPIRNDLAGDDLTNRGPGGTSQAAFKDTTPSAEATSDARGAKERPPHYQGHAHECGGTPWPPVLSHPSGPATAPSHPQPHDPNMDNGENRDQPKGTEQPTSHRPPKEGYGQPAPASRQACSNTDPFQDWVTGIQRGGTTTAAPGVLKPDQATSPTPQ